MILFIKYTETTHKVVQGEAEIGKLIIAQQLLEWVFVSTLEGYRVFNSEMLIEISNKLEELNKK